MNRSLPIVIMAVLLLFAGCGQPRRDPDTLVVWHWMTDRHDAFRELARDYEDETGIKVRFKLYAPSGDYSRKIVAAAQASVLPDIYGVLDKKKIFASFIKSGFVADLTDAFEDENGRWHKTFLDKALAVNRFEKGNLEGVEPGLYGVPIDITSVQMVYNRGLLEKAGVRRPPSTFDEYLEAVDALNRVGIAPFVSGWSELWLINCYAMNYAFNIMGEDKIMDTFQGEVPYTDPDWIEVFNIFKALVDHKALMEGIVIKGNKYAEQDFALERAAFAFNGSWCVNVYHKMNPDLDYGVMRPPPVSKNYPLKIWGGAGSSFVVNNSSPLKDKAVDFLRWLTAKKQQAFLAEKTRNLPANRHALSEAPELLAQFVGAMDQSTHPSIWPYNEDEVVSEAFARGIQTIIIGQKTPEQAAKDIQDVKERQMQKIRR